MADQEEHLGENSLINLVQKNIEEEKEQKQINNNKIKQNINPIHQYYNPINNNTSSNTQTKNNQKEVESNYEEILYGLSKLGLDDPLKTKISSPKKQEQSNFFQNPMINNNNKNNQKEMSPFNYFFGSGMQGGDLSKKMGENPTILGELGLNEINNNNHEENSEENEEEKEENDYKQSYLLNSNNINNDLNSQEKMKMMSNNNNNLQNIQINNNKNQMMQINNNNNMNLNMNNLNNNNIQYGNMDPRIRNIIQKYNNQNQNQQLMMNNFQRNQNNNNNNNNKNRKKKNRGNKINNNNNVNIQNMNLIMNQQQVPYNYQFMQNQNMQYIPNQSQQMNINQNYIQNNMNRYNPQQNQGMFPRGDGYPPVNMIGMGMNMNQNMINLDQIISRANNSFPGKFYVIKSIDESNILCSIRFKIWCSTIKGNQKLQKAYKEADKKYPIFLFFSVNGSGKFMGIALMKSDVEYKVNFNYWSQNDKWKGFFVVDWICIKDVPNKMFRNIINNLNENKPVTSSRDTQEICTEAGLKMLKIFRDYQQESTIFDSQNDMKYSMNQRQRDYGNNNLNMNYNMGRNMNMNNMNYAQNKGNMMNMNNSNMGNNNFKNMNNIPNINMNLNMNNMNNNNRNNMNIINNLNNNININNNIIPNNNIQNMNQMQNLIDNNNIGFNPMSNYQNIPKNIQEEKPMNQNKMNENNPNIDDLMMKIGNLGEGKNEQYDLNNILAKKNEEEGEDEK